MFGLSFGSKLGNAMMLGGVLLLVIGVVVLWTVEPHLGGTLGCLGVVLAFGGIGRDFKHQHNERERSYRHQRPAP